jgi:glycosyltransferase involved in cell wall biosynthesis
MKIFFEKWSPHRKGGIARDTALVYEQVLKSEKFEVAEKSPFFNLFNSKTLSRIGTILGGFGFRHRFIIEGVDVVYSPQVNSITWTSKRDIQIIRIHDIFPISNPEWFRFFPRKNFENALVAAAHRESTVFLCNSETTNRSLLTYFSKISLKTLVYPCQPKEFNSTPCGNCSSCKDKFLPRSSFYLMVGTIEPRKDYDFILRVLEEQINRNLRVCIVGRPGWKCRRLIKKIKSNPQITWYDDCCDGALQNLYLQTTAFISTSLDEGFNLPASEARLSGAPLLLRDIDVHRENHFGYASFFRNKNELTALLQKNFSLPRTEFVGQKSKNQTFPSESLFRLLGMSPD